MSQDETLNKILELAQTEPPRNLAVASISEVSDDGMTVFVSLPGDDSLIAIRQQMLGSLLVSGDTVLIAKPSSGSWLILGKIVQTGVRAFTSAIQVGTESVPVNLRPVGTDDRTDAPTEVGSFGLIASRTNVGDPISIDWFPLDGILAAMVQGGPFPQAEGTYYIEIELNVAGGITARGLKTPYQVLGELIPYQSTEPPNAPNGALWLDSTP